MIHSEDNKTLDGESPLQGNWIEVKNQKERKGTTAKKWGPWALEDFSIWDSMFSFVGMAPTYSSKKQFKKDNSLILNNQGLKREEIMESILTPYCLVVVKYIFWG